MINQNSYSDVIQKYRWAGKIRFISFTLLFAFLFLMKMVGGYGHLSSLFISLIFFEAIINQPYKFFLDRVDPYRFQFYQMFTDIVAITWVVYYMDGIEAPLVSIAYYMVILWAGVNASTTAVTFATTLSCILFSSVVYLEYTGFLPSMSYYKTTMPKPQMFSLLFGNVAFLLAFGYFSAYSSKIAKALDRKKQEEAIRYNHKFLATGYLISGIAHDVINYLAGIKGYTQMLRIKMEKTLSSGEHEMIDRIQTLEKKSSTLLSTLSQFATKPKMKFELADINEVISDVVIITAPLARIYRVTLLTNLASNLPQVKIDKDQIREAFTALILNSVDAMVARGSITIETMLSQDKTTINLLISDTGKGMDRKELSKMADPFYTTKSSSGLGLGLTIVKEIILRHSAKLDVVSNKGQGSTFTVALPVNVGNNL